MKNLKHLPSVLGILLVVTSFNVSVLGQSDKDLANVTNLGSSLRFDVSASHATVTLSVLAPDGRVYKKEFKAGTAPEFRLGDSREKYPDGEYSYEIRLTPALSDGVKEELKAAREKGTSDELQRDLKRRGILPRNPQVQSGGFTVVHGSIVLSRDTDGKDVAERKTTEPTGAPVVASTGRATYKVLRHHPRFFVFDQVIPDDLIVQGSICAGFDCVNNESFGTDTIRMKENNTRIQFDDTSVSAGFATNNWQIRANDQASGGSSFLGIVDQGATGNGETGTIVLAVAAGAPANSLRVSSGGDVGIKTATPVLDVHANTTDTPAIRLEQNNSGGFTAQTWDIGANEANFFVRDVTGGSLLSFRIRPGAPTSSLDISANGNVGVATASPDLQLEVFGDVGLPVNTGTTPTGITRFSQAGGTGVMDFGFGGNPGFGWIQATSSANLGTNFGLLLNPNGGNVGIGTAAPTDLLSVNGTASKPGGGTWAVFSDERLKRVRGTYNSGLKAVMRLQPLRYEYKPDNAMGIKSEGEHVGFSAQDVQKVIPEAVTTNSSGFLMVKSDPIIWTMLNAIKEQQREIDELKKEVRRLRATRRRR